VRSCRPEVPAAVDELIASLLAKDPGRRADADTVRARLAEARSALSAGSWPWTVPIAAVWNAPAPQAGSRRAGEFGRGRADA
jgi:hypothetical protein